MATWSRRPIDRRTSTVGLAVVDDSGSWRPATSRCTAADWWHLGTPWPAGSSRTKRLSGGCTEYRMDSRYSTAALGRHVADVAAAAGSSRPSSRWCRLAGDGVAGAVVGEHVGCIWVWRGRRAECSRTCRQEWTVVQSVALAVAAAFRP